MVNMNSLVTLFVLNRVTFSTGDQELATFAAGEKGFSFGEEGMLLLTSQKGLYMYICDTTVKEWNRREDCQTPLLYIRGIQWLLKYLFGEADVASNFLLLEDS